ncbi:MAG: hypothetical protein HPY45_09780 [Anaerolineae bacterium]|nr:hypothetical protein [Anaerolineae bacterium]
MFNNRDLAILGAGGLLAVFALLLPFSSFFAKLAAGFIVLALFMILALLRLGPDRVTPEEWLLRRIRFAISARAYTFHHNVPGARTVSPAEIPAPAAAPLWLAIDEVGIYPLMTVFLAVVGVYTVAWLYRGGAEDVALFIQNITGGLP